MHNHVNLFRSHLSPTFQQKALQANPLISIYIVTDRILRVELVM